MSEKLGICLETITESPCQAAYVKMRVFLAAKLVLMGYTVSAEGIKSYQSKVRAIKYAPEPTKNTELKSFLGMVTSYSQCLSNLAIVAAPLYELLKKGKSWNWTCECKNLRPVQ